jgi:hypothetical protein
VPAISAENSTSGRCQDRARCQDLRGAVRKDVRSDVRRDVVKDMRADMDEATLNTPRTYG